VVQSLNVQMATLNRTGPAVPLLFHAFLFGMMYKDCGSLFSGNDRCAVASSICRDKHGNVQHGAQFNSCLVQIGNLFIHSLWTLLRQDR